MTYIGRFAPSPTGPLHAGSLVAALASWLDARAHGGCWLVRIEDVDAARCRADLPRRIMRQLLQHALVPDAEPAVQSQRHAQYQQALNQLTGCGLAYPCTCSRKQIAGHWAGHGQSPQRHGERVYPGTCRPQRGAEPAPVPGQPHAWRLDVAACLQRQGLPADAATVWNDRRLGAQQQVVTQAVGDFVLRRADGLWAYQLAVVVDDAAQHITHVVRGKDLADNTPRQILLQQALGVPTPSYLHTPLVCGANGEKLSKQNGAAALDLHDPLQALGAAARVLGLPAVEQLHENSPAQALEMWVNAWARTYNGRP